MPQQTMPPKVSLSPRQGSSTDSISDAQLSSYSSGTPEYSIVLSKNANISSPWSDSVQAVLEQPPASLTQQFIWAGLLFLGVSIAWTWFGKVEDVSHAQGRLVPLGDVFKVQSVVGGEVTRIFVEEGQQVKAGQAIAELDQQIAQNEVHRLEQQLTTYQFQLTQLQNLINRAHSELDTHRAIAQATLSAQALEIEQSQISALTSETVLSQLEDEHHAYETRLERLAPLVEAGALAEESLFDVEQSLRDRQQAITQQEGTLEQSRAEISQHRANLEQRQAEAEQQVLEIQQKLQQLELDALELQAKIEDTEMSLNKARTESAQTRLQAPVAGIVSDLTIQNVGEVIQPGITVAEISPSDATLVLSADLPSAEAGLVNPGMPVQLKFDAFPYQDYGVVPGIVVTVAPDSELTEQLGAIYNIKIQLERNYVEHEGESVELRAGQTANAEIIIRQRRILDILLDPLRKLKRGGMSL